MAQLLPSAPGYTDREGHAEPSVRPWATVQLFAAVGLLVCPIGLVALGQNVTMEAGWRAAE